MYKFPSPLPTHLPLDPLSLPILHLHPSSPLYPNLLNGNSRPAPAPLPAFPPFPLPPSRLNAMVRGVTGVFIPPIVLGLFIPPIVLGLASGRWLCASHAFCLEDCGGGANRIALCCSGLPSSSRVFRARRSVLEGIMLMTARTVLAAKRKL